MIGTTTISGSRKPLGYQQIPAGGLAAATKLTLPTLTGALAGFNVTYIIIQAEAQVVRWRDDGVAPTATVGMQIAVGGELDYTGDPSTIQFIQAAAGGILNVSYFG